MPFLAPLVPALMSIIPTVTGLAGEVGGMLAPALLSAGEAIGLPLEVAAPLSTFLSPEIIGGGLGYAAGGTKGLEEGLMGGATLGGGLGGLGDLFGNVASGLGAPAGLTDAAAGTTGASPIGNAVNMGVQAAPILAQVLGGQPVPQGIAPSRTMTPTPTSTAVGTAPPGGPSGASLVGNTAPQVGPWLSNFWNTGNTGSIGNVPSVGSAAPATSQMPSATNQQQLTSP